MIRLLFSVKSLDFVKFKAKGHENLGSTLSYLCQTCFSQVQSASQINYMNNGSKWRQERENCLQLVNDTEKLSRNYCPLTKNFYVILLQSQFRQSGMSVIFIGLRKLHWHFLKNARIQGSSQWFSAILITLFVWCCDSCVARYWSKRESVSSMPVHSERKLGFLVGFTYEVVIEL